MRHQPPSSPVIMAGLFRAQLGTGMSDFLAWVSFGLQVYSMWPIWPVATRSKRVSQGQSEINLGFYRRCVTWTEERDTSR